MCKIVILIVAALALASAQDATSTTVPSTTGGSTVSPSTTTAPAPQTCSSETVSSINWSNNALFDTWVQLTRTPIGNSEACMVITANLESDQNTLNISAIHSSSSTSLYQNVQERAIVKLVNGGTSGYSVTFITDNTEQTPVFIKLLQLVENNNFIVGCGYTNASDASTSYGFILGRSGHYNSTATATVNNNAAALYSNFQNNAYGSIEQDGCYQNSATKSVPLITGVLALALLLIKAH
ncbi:uncharacterized protein LOC6563140 [Drosophila grimshawi]|uniref:GH18210 n=1 Tax=Drosophila grimshawi TaxID=7222 RepID=B4JFT3_DROGR|nr:uncharacterized protein LOC6563140 [Drosophila grimshawi]EDV93564.1 GH18210 [Drosophila grimshawi]